MSREEGEIALQAVMMKDLVDESGTGLSVLAESAFEGIPSHCLPANIGLQGAVKASQGEGCTSKS